MQCRTCLCRTLLAIPYCWLGALRWYQGPLTICSHQALTMKSPGWLLIRLWFWCLLCLHGHSTTHLLTSYTLKLISLSILGDHLALPLPICLLLVRLHFCYVAVGLSINSPLNVERFLLFARANDETSEDGASGEGRSTETCFIFSTLIVYVMHAYDAHNIFWQNFHHIYRWPTSPTWWRTWPTGVRSFIHCPQRRCHCTYCFTPLTAHHSCQLFI